jgi:hypothetical protein
MNPLAIFFFSLAGLLGLLALVASYARIKIPETELPGPSRRLSRRWPRSGPGIDVGALGEVNKPVKIVFIVGHGGLRNWTAVPVSRKLASEQ